MHHGTVLGDANKKPVPKNSPVMHCQRRYYQASCAMPKWLIEISSLNTGQLNILPAESLSMHDVSLTFRGWILTWLRDVGY